MTALAIILAVTHLLMGLVFVVTFYADGDFQHTFHALLLAVVELATAAFLIGLVL